VGGGSQPNSVGVVGLSPALFPFVPGDFGASVRRPGGCGTNSTVRYVCRLAETILGSDLVSVSSPRFTRRPADGHSLAGKIAPSARVRVRAMPPTVPLNTTNEEEPLRKVGRNGSWYNRPPIEVRGVVGQRCEHSRSLNLEIALTSNRSCLISAGFCAGSQAFTARSFLATAHL